MEGTRQGTISYNGSDYSIHMPSQITHHYRCKCQRSKKCKATLKVWILNQTYAKYGIPTCKSGKAKDIIDIKEIMKNTASERAISQMDVPPKKNLGQNECRI
jgi:hypothetical protein